MNILKITQKGVSVAFFLLFFLSLHAQQKIIGFANRGALDGNGTAFSINTNGSGYQKNVQFPYAPGQGVDMTDGNDGYFYGSTTGNGYGDAGCVFKIKPDGTDYTVLKKFTRTTDGGSIRWRPVVAPDGFLYGVCEDGAQFSNGTIWKLKKDGTSFTVLKVLNNSAESTSGFYGSLVLGLDGKLYGTVSGSNGHIIRINTNGTGFTKLVSFTNTSGGFVGSGPRSPLLLASDGNFYGVCVGGGTTGKGVAFKYNASTNTYTLLKTFTDNDGTYPATTPVEGIGGYIFGGCPNYGTLNGGTLWRIKKDGSGFAVLQQIDLATMGNRPGRKLYIHTDGLVYGTMCGYGPLNAGTFFRMAQDGSGFTVLRSNFEGGEQPWALIYKETDGRFYIPFNYGGQGSGGILASLNPDGSDYRRHYSFAYQTEGYGPVVAPTVITNTASPQYGKAFGVSTSGGLFSNGVLFSYYTGHTVQRHTILRHFKGTDGYSAAGRSGAFLASDGWLYGIMGYGGPISGNAGTAYKINPTDTSTFTVIKSFGAFGSAPTGCSNPGDMIEAADGYLYGSTAQRGDNNRGTMFKMQKDGSNFSNIYQYGGSNTLYSAAGFIQDPITQQIIGTGTLSNGDEVIFAINTNGSGLTLIKTFTYADAATNGRNITAPLRLEGDTLYGSCHLGGSNGLGNIYKMHKNGTGFTVIKNFTVSDGGNPYGNLQLSDDGYIYGTCASSYNPTPAPTIYKIRKDGSDFQILKNFGIDQNNIEGNSPGPVILLPCTTPQNASEIVFGNVTTSSITLTGFTPPASGGVTGYVIIMNTTNSFTPPINGSIPSANTSYSGSGEQVVYAGNTIQPLNITGLLPNTQYWFKVFAYGCNGILYSNTNTTNNPNAQRTMPTGVVRPANLMARLDGVNDYTNAGDVNALEGNNAISFGGWVKPTSFPTANFKVKSFVGKGDGVNAAATAFQAGLYRNDGSQLLVMAQIGIGVAMAKVEIVVDSSMFRINQWSHFFVTWASGDKVKLYINGRLVVQSLVNYSGTINNTTAGLKLGSSDNGANEEHFHGDMEEFQFYNTAISQCNIRQRKHITLNGTEAGLVAYYQFNEPDGIATFNDYINLHHAAKQNGALALVSDLSAGGGTSECISVQSTDNVYQFSAADFSNRLELSFPALSPNGLMNGSYVEAMPVGGNPNPGSNMLPGYWIIDNYGSNQSNLQATLTFRFPGGTLTDPVATNYQLYKRPSNGSGAWDAFPISGISLEAGNHTITVTGIPSFSQFVITSNVSVLPLQLISFEGTMQGEDALLRWHTTNEVNIARFEIERKLPKENGFSVFAAVKAKNNLVNYYNITDYKLLTGITWYRLKITDKDGKITYSNIVSVANKKPNTITIFPNPAKEIITLRFESRRNGKASIVSVDGKIIQTNINITQQVNSINVSSILPGMYFLQLETKEGIETIQFIKQ